jgi:hypothetical protein
VPDSRFRPGLDDIGGLDDWALETPELERIALLQAEAANLAIARLDALFGRASRLFGAADLAKRLGAMRVDQEGIRALARAICATDYFGARAAPPRMAAGGLTEPGNRRRWARLGPHPTGRLMDALSANLAEGVLWRCVLGRMPEQWLPVPTLERTIAAALTALPAYDAVTVELAIDTDPPGGLRWVARLAADIGSGRPRVVELIRTADGAPTEGSFAVAYAMEALAGRAAQGWRLRCFEPKTGGSHTLRLERPAATSPYRFVEEDGETTAPVIKALRLLDITPGRPPRFGARRRLRWLLPWTLLWWVRRWLRLRAERPAPG